MAICDSHALRNTRWENYVNTLRRLALGMRDLRRLGNFIRQPAHRFGTLL